MGIKITSIILCILVFIVAGCNNKPKQNMTKRKLGERGVQSTTGKPSIQYYKNKPEKELFTSAYDNSAANGGGRSPDFVLKKTSLITKITTFHINGVKHAGKISMKDSNGKTYGPWQAKGVDYAELKNAYWESRPNSVLKPGTYTIIDSDPSTWSSSGEGLGIVWIIGKQ